MPELDFHGLRDDAGDAARQPEFATIVRRAGRLRSRRYAAATTAAAVLAVALAVAGTTLAAGGNRLGTPTGAGSASASPTDEPAPWRTVQWAGAADAEHLYAVRSDCQQCPRRLMGSDDGGRTWRQRHVFAAADFNMRASVFVAGPRTLVLPETWPVGVAAVPGASPSADPQGSHLPGTPSADPEGSESTSPGPWPTPGPLRVSTDGGVTWRVAQRSTVPVPAAAAGTAIAPCQLLRAPLALRECPVHAIDPVTGQVAPLANQPPLLEARPAAMTSGAGLWVEGFDRATRRPAVAVSADRGRTWTTAVFAAEPAEPSEPVMPSESAQSSAPATHPVRLRPMDLPSVTTADGRTAYALFIEGADGPRVYRSTDAGRTWTRTNGEQPLSDAPLATSQSWVTRDGAHVVLDQPDGIARFLVSPDGRRYTPLRTTGLEAEAGDSMHVPAMAGNRYVYAGRDAVYLSDDGRRWHAARM